MKKIDLTNPATKKALLISTVAIFILLILFLLFNLLKPKSSKTLPQSPVIQTQKSSLAPITYTKLIPIKEGVNRDCVGLCPIETNKSATESSANKKQAPTPTPQAGHPTPSTPTPTTEETILAQDSGATTEKGGETILDTNTSPTPTTEEVQTTQPPVTGYIQNTILLGGISLLAILLAFAL